MQCPGRRFWAPQEGRADLHAVCAEGEGRRDSPSVGDPPGGNHRNIDGIGDLGHERHRADLPARVVVEEHPAVSAGFEPLGDHRIAPVIDEPACLGDRRRRRQDGRPRRV